MQYLMHVPWKSTKGPQALPPPSVWVPPAMCPVSRQHNVVFKCLLELNLHLKPLSFFVGWDLNICILCLSSGAQRPNLWIRWCLVLSMFLCELLHCVNTGEICWGWKPLRIRDRTCKDSKGICFMTTWNVQEVEVQVQWYGKEGEVGWGALGIEWFWVWPRGPRRCRSASRWKLRLLLCLVLCPTNLPLCVLRLLCTIRALYDVPCTM